MDLVYRSIATGLAPPSETKEINEGLMGLLKTVIGRWQADSDSTKKLRALANTSVQDLPNLNFQRAILRALLALIDGDETTAEKLVMYLSGQGFDRRELGEFGILSPINRATALGALRSLARWIRQAGFRGW